MRNADALKASCYLKTKKRNLIGLVNNNLFIVMSTKAKKSVCNLSVREKTSNCNVFKQEAPALKQNKLGRSYVVVCSFAYGENERPNPRDNERNHGQIDCEHSTKLSKRSNGTWGKPQPICIIRVHLPAQRV